MVAERGCAFILSIYLLIVLQEGVFTGVLGLQSDKMPGDEEPVNGGHYRSHKRLKCPDFNMDTMSFDDYKFELELWSEMTDTPKNMKAGEIFMSLPNVDKTSIKSFLRSKMTRADMRKDSGFEDILKLMDEHLGGEDLGRVWGKFCTFDNMSRSEDQSVENYIVKFDIAYNNLVKEDGDIKIPSHVRGMMLLKRAGLANDVEKLCLTGIDLTDKVNFYDKAKLSLKKFAGEGGSGCATVKNMDYFSTPAVKQEICEAEAYVGYRGSDKVWRRRKWGGAQAHSSRIQDGGMSTKPRDVNSEKLGYKASTNPLGRNGLPKRCNICDSILHMYAECPHKPNGANMAEFESSEDEEETITLFTGRNEHFVNELRMECENSAVLDSACTKNVCSQLWLDTFVRSLSQSAQSKIVCTPSNNKFRFGGGELLRSKGKYIIPAFVAGKSVNIETDVVDSHIPLLLSLQSMKKMGLKLDTVTDTAEIFGKKVSLNFTSSGHYSVPLCEDQVFYTEDVLKVDLGSNLEEEKCKLKHMHKQFGHVCSKKLSELLKGAKSWKPHFAQLLDEISSGCETCKLYRKEKPNPIVSMPKSRYFNDLVTVDLKKWANGWICYFIDDFSRLVVARWIPSKQPKEVVKAYMLSWLASGYGRSNTLMWDIGGEFNNEQVMEMSSKLGIRIITTASYSPFSNGTCERNHAVVDSILQKLVHDHKDTDLNELLAWSCCAKNSLCMFGGFSPYQIVYGKSPSLPGDGDMFHPPALCEPKSETLRKHLNVLHSARSAFVEGMSSEKIKRALNHKIRILEHPLQTGDVVYYKRVNSDLWLGPATVVSQEGKTVFIKHGAFIVRIYRSRVVLKDHEYERKKGGVNGSVIVNPKASLEKVLTGNDGSQIQGKTHTSSDKRSDDSDSELDDNHDPTVQNSENSEGLRNPESLEGTKHVNVENIKVKDVIEYREEPSEPWKKVTVVSKAGKSTGKNKHWVNVESETNRYSLNLEDVEIKTSPGQVQNDVNCVLDDYVVIDLDSDSEDELDTFVTKCTKNDVIKVQKPESEVDTLAKLSEIEKLKHYCVYDEVPDCGQACVGTRWVLKRNPDGTTKARLVAKGFQEKEYIQSDSPTIGRAALRLFLCISLTFGWDIHCMDIRSAFLQGKDIERDIYIKPPKDFGREGMVWKLKKCLYGLKDGSRNFYFSIKEHLESCGCTVSNLEPTLYTYKVNGELMGWLLSHVDDFVCAGTQTFHEKVIKPLSDRFNVSKDEKNQFKYVGMAIEKHSECITVSMSDFIGNIDVESFRRLMGSRDLSTPEYTQFRSLVGKLNWLAGTSRPDMSFSTVEFSTKFTQATTKDLNQVFKTVQKAKVSDFKVMFSHLDTASLSMLVFTDASLANLRGSNSCGGHIIFLVDRHMKCCPISWHSGRLKRVVRSTLAAECMALLAGLEECIYLNEVLKFCLGKKLKITGIVDSKSLLQSLVSTSLVDEKRLRLDVNCIKEMIENENLEVRWVPGNYQLANVLTKAGASPESVCKVLSSGKLSGLIELSWKKK